MLIGAYDLGLLGRRRLHICVNSLSALLEPVLAPPALGVFDGPDGEDLEFVDEAA
jgi:hypothetical protein